MHLISQNGQSNQGGHGLMGSVKMCIELCLHIYFCLFSYIGEMWDVTPFHRCTHAKWKVGQFSAWTESVIILHHHQHELGQCILTARCALRRSIFPWFWHFVQKCCYGPINVQDVSKKSQQYFFRIWTLFTSLLLPLLQP